MDFDGAFGHVKGPADGFVGEAFGDQLEDGTLTNGESQVPAVAIFARWHVEVDQPLLRVGIDGGGWTACCGCQRPCQLRQGWNRRH